MIQSGTGFVQQPKIVGANGKDIMQITGSARINTYPRASKWIHEKLKPIYEDVCKGELLHKCLHGQTQNANESLNNLTWMRCPKRVFVTKSVLEMGVNSAVLEFNNGAVGIGKVLQQYKIASEGFFDLYSLCRFGKQVTSSF